MAELPHAKRLLNEINARPAAQRVDALKAQFNFKTEMDAQARKAFFPQPIRRSWNGSYTPVGDRDHVQIPSGSIKRSGFRSMAIDLTACVGC